MKKIIWNITRKCGFHCNICATQSDKRKELSYNEKRQTLLKICSFKSEIEELDFAGGDPLFDKDSREIIKEAINELGKDMISVTTTGIGIDQISMEERCQFLYKCELSLDNIGNCDANIRKEDLYSKKNLEAIYENSRYINELTINIPIFDTEFPVDHLENLICMINGIAVEKLRVNILRYMPVGKVELYNYPKSYAPGKYVDYIQKNLKKDINIHFHCALRGITGVNNNCNMLTRKIGIDCEGNVFMCAWAGYLRVSKEKNPFFLGNILEYDLYEMLNNDITINVKNHLKENRKSCCIFSYLNSSEHDMFSNRDPLYERGMV